MDFAALVRSFRDLVTDGEVHWSLPFRLAIHGFSLAPDSDGFCACPTCAMTVGIDQQETAYWSVHKADCSFVSNWESWCSSTPNDDALALILEFQRLSLGDDELGPSPANEILLWKTRHEAALGLLRHSAATIESLQNKLSLALKISVGPSASAPAEVGEIDVGEGGGWNEAWGSDDDEEEMDVDNARHSDDDGLISDRRDLTSADGDGVDLIVEPAEAETGKGEPSSPVVSSGASVDTKEVKSAQIEAQTTCAPAPIEDKIAPPPGVNPIEDLPSSTPIEDQPSPAPTPAPAPAPIDDKTAPPPAAKVEDKTSSAPAPESAPIEDTSASVPAPIDDKTAPTPLAKQTEPAESGSDSESFGDFVEIDDKTEKRRSKPNGKPTVPKPEQQGEVGGVVAAKVDPVPMKIDPPPQPKTSAPVAGGVGSITTDVSEMLVQLNNLIRVPATPPLEGKVLGLLAGCADINGLLLRVDLKALFSWLSGPNSHMTRGAVCMTFSQVRVKALSVACAALLCVGIQNANWTNAFSNIRDISGAMSGDKLLSFKLSVGVGRAGRNLLALVYQFITSVPIRDEILLHFKNEIKNITRKGSVVLVDPSQGMTVRWDSQLPTQTQAKPPQTPAAPPPAEPTARDVAAKQFTMECLNVNSADEIAAEATKKKSKNSSEMSAEIMANQRPIAVMAPAEIEMFASLFPESKIIVISADEKFAQSVSALNVSAVSAIFLYSGSSPAPAPAAEDKIIKFQSFVSAARHAKDRGLMSGEALARIARAAVQDFQIIELPFDTQAARDTRWRGLCEDLTTIGFDMKQTSKYSPSQADEIKSLLIPAGGGGAAGGPARDVDSFNAGRIDESFFDDIEDDGATPSESVSVSSPSVQSQRKLHPQMIDDQDYISSDSDDPASPKIQRKKLAAKINSNSAAAAPAQSVNLPPLESPTGDPDISLTSKSSGFWSTHSRTSARSDGINKSESESEFERPAIDMTGLGDDSDSDD